MTYSVEAICTGKAAPFRGAEKSAFAKQARAGRIGITENGITGDEQADRRVHGGPEMAVHLYPLDHSEFWRKTIGDHELLDDPGAFGSNLAVKGVTEEKVFIGDRFRIGSSLLEVSQPRQPCWKIEHRFAVKGMVAAILKSGRCGWYFRVLETGHAAAGDILEKVGEADSRLSVLQTFQSLVAAPTQAEHAVLKQLAETPTLTPRLREKARARLG